MVESIPIGKNRLRLFVPPKTPLGATKKNKGIVPKGIHYTKFDSGFWIRGETEGLEHLGGVKINLEGIPDVNDYLVKLEIVGECTLPEGVSEDCEIVGYISPQAWGSFGVFDLYDFNLPVMKYRLGPKGKPITTLLEISYKEAYGLSDVSWNELKSLNLLFRMPYFKDKQLDYVIIKLENPCLEGRK